MNSFLSTWMPFLEVVVLVILAMLWPGYGARGLDRLERWFARCAQSRWAMAGVAVGIFIFSAALSLRILNCRNHPFMMSLPIFLQADTFAHGRLANPPHPMSEHFEDFHILFHQVYAAKYPPAQGLFLALGQVMGRPIIGVWISTALAGAALFLDVVRCFLQLPWALVGTVMAFFNPQVLIWNWSFWGGSAAFCGGALALGGFCRLWKTPSSFPGGMMGLGMGILCLSRPYEGVALSLMLVAVCVFTAWRQQRTRPALFSRCLWPMACWLLPFILFHLSGTSIVSPATR